MRCPLPLQTVALALALGLGGSAHAATNAQLAELLQQLNARVNKLEQANADLQRELAASRASTAQAAASPQSAPLERRVQALEQHQTLLADSLDRDTISEKEPDLSARLKAVEAKTQEMAGPLGKLKGLDGIKAGMSLSMVAQKSPDAQANDAQLSYRTDAFVSLPLDAIGDIEQTVFTHVRLGQGAGLTGLPASYANPNATFFQLGLGAENSVALLAQAWYQASIPLPLGGFKRASRQKLEITVGKMDPFAFFDQNAAAGDEGRQFLNSVFVHNPLLDAGGDIGADPNGFAPGLRVSLLDTSSKLENWRLSLGLFGAGQRGANYQGSLGAPMAMLQAETQQRFFGGLLGNYRAYAWSNPQSVPFGLPLPLADTTLVAPERHTGWGLSMDQRLGDGITVFSRYGQEASGQIKFDRALTLGLETNGSYWSRGGDSLGLGLGWLRTSDAYRAYKLTDPADARALDGSERVAELYYRWRVAKQFELTPSLQFIGSPGGDANASDVRIFSLRSQFSF
jgi:hypothetical protein